MKSALKKIAIELNKNNIRWALGGSFVLAHYHLVDVVNDIDILIAETDAQKAESIFSTFAVKGHATRKEPFATKQFHKYKYLNTSIDVMGGFQIYHEKGLYALDFDVSSITNELYIDDIQVPISSLEDWYILYALIPGKQYKADLIESHWRANGIQHPSLLKRAMIKSLPGHLKMKLESINMLY